MSLNLVNPHRFAAGGGAFSPSDISDLKAWYDANLGITLNGSDVSQWDDQSGEGNDLIQTTAVNQPELISSDSAFNNEPSVNFDGGVEYLQTAAFAAALTQPVTIFMVARRTVSGTNQSFFDGIDASNRLSVLQSTTTWRIRSPTLVNGTIANNNNAHLYAVRFNTTSSTAYVDGGTPTHNGVNTGTDDLTGLTVGANYLFNSGTVAISQLLVYEKLLTDAELNDLGQFFDPIYNITWTDI